MDNAPMKRASMDAERPPLNLSRPSSFSLRPSLMVNTRMRSRSVTGTAPPSLAIPPSLSTIISPTLMGSPIQPISIDHTSEKPDTSEESDDNHAEASVKRFAPTIEIRSWDSPTTRQRSNSAPKPQLVLPRLDYGIRRNGSYNNSTILSVPQEPTIDEGAPSPTRSHVSDVSFEEEGVHPPEEKTLSAFLPQVGILAGLFVTSFLGMLLLISTLPRLSIPHALDDIPSLTEKLSEYRASGFLAEMHLFVVLSFLLLWKQCFSIPGSILSNILMGALYGTGVGTFWVCIHTASGSLGAYMIAKIVKPMVEHYFTTPLKMTRKALCLPDEEVGSPAITTAQSPDSGDLFTYLLLARFFPLLPYSVLNIICGVLAIPVVPFWITLFIGSFPFNFATVSVGELVSISLGSDKPLEKIWSREIIIKLIAVTLISVLPLVFKERLKRLLGGKRLNHVLARASEMWMKGESAMSKAMNKVSSSMGYSPISPTDSEVRVVLRRDGTARRKWNKSWAISPTELSDLSEKSEGHF